MKFIAFDIEVAKVPQEGSEWVDQNLGISCAATLDSDGDLRLWHGARVGNRFHQRMSRHVSWELSMFLRDRLRDGYVPLTYNGAGFDFRVLLRELAGSQLCEDQIEHLALNHIDIAFAFFADKGFMIGLDTAAKGMGLSGKTEGMTGAKAPELWAGDLDNQLQVLAYVSQDVQTTANLYREVLNVGRLQWKAKSGNTGYWIIPQKPGGRAFLPTVQEAMNFSEPDTSWMDEPWPRSKFVGWLMDAVGAEGGAG